MDSFATRAVSFDPSLFFQNRACAYFPCHQGLPEELFNCLLCYCPFYALGEACGGNFSYTAKGFKNCTDCTVPHDGVSGVELVKSRFAELADLAAERRSGASAGTEGAAEGDGR